MIHKSKWLLPSIIAGKFIYPLLLLAVLQSFHRKSSVLTISFQPYFLKKQIILHQKLPSRITNRIELTKFQLAAGYLNENNNENTDHYESKKVVDASQQLSNPPNQKKSMLLKQGSKQSGIDRQPFNSNHIAGLVNDIATASSITDIQRYLHTLIDFNMQVLKPQRLAGLNSNEIRTVTNSLVPYLAFMDFITLTDSIWCVGSLIKENKISVSDNANFKDFLSKCLFQLSSRHFSNISLPTNILSKSFGKLFSGFGRLDVAIASDVDLSHLTTWLASPLATSAILASNGQGVATILWSLGKLGVSLESMQKVTRKYVFQRLYQVSKEMNDQAISNTIVGLNHMDVQWDQ